MPKAGTVEVDVEPGMTGFGTKLAQGIARTDISAVGQEMSRVGGYLTTRLTLPIAAGFAFAFKEANESVKVGRQTEAVIRSTGGAANITATAVGNLANRLSQKVGIDDEAIQSGENLLLTFKNIRNEAGKGNDIFRQATIASLDMSTAMGTDMRTSALQLGKALNDPIKGMTALGRAGVQFTADQKEQIKALVASGDLLGAQKIILKEVMGEFGGSAEAAATPFDHLKVKVQNLAEEVGFRALPVAERFIDVIGDLADAFLDMPDWAQDFVVGGLAITAAAGPMLKLSGSVLQLVGPVLKLGAAWATSAAAAQAAQVAGAGVGQAALPGLSAATPAATGLGAALAAIALPAGMAAFALTHLGRQGSDVDVSLRDLSTKSVPELSKAFNELGTNGASRFQELREKLKDAGAENVLGPLSNSVAGLREQLNQTNLFDVFKMELDNIQVKSGALGGEVSSLAKKHLDLAVTFVKAAEAAGVSKSALDNMKQSVVDAKLRHDDATAANERFTLQMMKLRGEIDATQPVVRALDGTIIGYNTAVGLIPASKVTNFENNAPAATFGAKVYDGAIRSIPTEVITTISIRSPQNIRAGAYGPEVNFGYGWVPVAVGHADGAVYMGGIRRMAEGGFGRDPQIAKGGSNILWAEGGDEAYIPFDPAKRDRATAILATVASEFGLQLMSAASPSGGGGSVAPAAPPVVVSMAGANIYGWDDFKRKVGQAASENGYSLSP